MNKNTVFSLVNLLWTPVLLILLGLILLFNPDSASAFLGKVIGWLLCAVGVGWGIAAFFGRDGKIGKALTAALCLAAGCWLLRNPLALAESLGRLLGVFLLLRGGRDVLSALQRRNAGMTFLPSLILAAAVLAVGVILLVLPMTTSRILLNLCGVVVLVIGSLTLLDRLRSKKLPGDGDDPNIIDAL